MSIRKRFSRVIAVLAIAMLLPAIAAASAIDRILERGKLVVATSANMPSMSFTDADGRVTGFDIDLARIMASLMGVQLEIRVLPFKDLVPAVESGKADVAISNLTITPKRNLQVAFAGPYMVSGKCIVTKDKALAGVDGEEAATRDLNTAETKIAVLGGSTSEAFARELMPKATILTVDKYDEAADLVRSDNANGMLTDYPICLATLKANPDAGFASVFSMLTYEPIGIALPPDDAQMLNWTEHFLQRLDATNGFEELSRRWFGKARLLSR